MKNITSKHEKVILEGYVYEYCHADDCHTILLPRKITVAEVRMLAEKLTWLSEASKKKLIEEIILPSFVHDKVISWHIYYGILDKEAKVPCEILEKFKGKKVRITIEVVK